MALAKAHTHTDSNEALYNFFPSPCSMDGADLCFEIVKRADAGFVYSEAVAR